MTRAAWLLKAQIGLIQSFYRANKLAIKPHGVKIDWNLKPYGSCSVGEPFAWILSAKFWKHSRIIKVGSRCYRWLKCPYTQFKTSLKWCGSHFLDDRTLQPYWDIWLGTPDDKGANTRLPMMTLSVGCQWQSPQVNVVHVAILEFQLLGTVNLLHSLRLYWN